MIYLGVGKELAAISNTGNFEWRVNLGDTQVETTPLVAADGNVYAIGFYRELNAVRTNGLREWVLPLSIMTATASPTVTADGHLYVGNNFNMFYKIKTGVPPAGSPWPMFGRDARHTSKATGK